MMLEIFEVAIYWQDENDHRVCYLPGMDLTNAPQEVQDAAAVHWTPDAVAAWREANQGEAMPPSPAYGAAWADLIVSPLYQRALGLAFEVLAINTAMTLFGMAYQSHRDLSHEVWASALSASAGHLATAINATPYPLTEAEMGWIADWSDRHYLGLTFPWEIANG